MQESNGKYEVIDNKDQEEKIAKMAFSISEAAEFLGIGKNTMATLVHSKGFPRVKVGRRIIIPINALNQWLLEASKCE